MRTLTRRKFEIEKHHEFDVEHGRDSWINTTWIVHFMDKRDKALRQLLSGSLDRNIAFDDLCQLLRQLGFDERVRGSHHIFRKSGIVERINLQRDDHKAKPYQVRQVRKVLLKYNLGGED